MNTDGQSSEISSPESSRRLWFEQQYQQLAAEDPLFSPHVSVAFEVIETIGEGGMGQVYRVHDLRVGREAALKVLRDAESSEDASRRFLREACLTARLDHPAIPPVYEVGRTARGELYMLMRLIEGRTLSAEIRDYHDQHRPPAKLRQILQAMCRVCEALDYAHSKGFVHRDVKPENIMIGQFGEVMLLDWGIARDFSETRDDEPLLPRQTVIDSSQLQQAGLTQAGDFVGTPGYMPPEQYEQGEIDGRTDVFAVASVLTQVLTDQPAVDGDTALIRMIGTLEGRIRSPVEIDQDIPEELDSLIARGLSEDPANRFASVRDLNAELTRFLNDELLETHDYSLWRRGLRFIRQRPAMVLVLFLVLVLAFALTAMKLERDRRLREQQAEAQRLRLAKREAEQRATAAKDSESKIRETLKLLERARQLVERGGQPADIKRALNSALKQGGRSEPLLKSVAKIAFRAQLFQYSEQHWRELTNRFPPHYEAWYFLHQIEVREGLKTHWTGRRQSKALTRLTEIAAERKETNEYTLFTLGVDAQSDGKMEQAIQFYERALQHSSRLAEVYLNCGAARAALGDLEGAIKDFTSCVALDPKASDAYYNRGNQYARLGQQLMAIGDYTRAIEVNGKNAQAYFARGASLAIIGNREGALRDYNSAIKVNPRLPQPYANRASLRYAMGDKAGSLYDFETFVKLAPNHPAAQKTRQLAARLRAEGVKPRR